MRALACSPRRQRWQTLLVLATLTGLTLAACGEPRGGRGYPLATFVCHNPAQVGTIETFDASASTDDGIIESYTFDFGDGTPPVRAAAPAVRHRFEREGTFTVQLDVVDELGNVAFERRVLRVVAEAPTCVDRCGGHMRCVDARCWFSPAQCREGDPEAPCPEGRLCCGGYCDESCE